MAPRFDAQASSTRTGIGGWFPHLGGHSGTHVHGQRGNGSALNKLMSTRFPSSAALVEWAPPRESNKEADALANGVTDGFNPELEMKVDVAKLKWAMLPKELDAGRQAEESHKMAKERGQLPNGAMKERRKKLEDRLRIRIRGDEPWESNRNVIIIS